ncbi:STAS/SEC14 domain-containing protein [Jejudonia soesokkakensis]|uniref:STAS/SEC14 domain-containing protein n=1 Tax=Jejudonia soesokkakensis TaxID=1323432 RepID=A0ABW2MT02_9FLAO
MHSSFTFSKDTVGFLIDGNVNEKAINKLQIEILEKLKSFDKINLYLEDSNIESFTLPAIVNQLMFKLEHGDRFRKIAIVTDRKWIHMCGSIENIFLSGTLKNFDISERLKAMNWISS